MHVQMESNGLTSISGFSVYFSVFLYSHTNTFMKQKDIMEIGIKKKTKSQDCEVRVCHSMY